MSSDRPRRVLVVDDNALLSAVLRDLIDGIDGFTVVATAKDGEEGLRLVHQLDPDIVTLDIEMPIMDGLETLLHLRADHPDLPVIMFSTLTEAGATATLTALERGASDYVTKPANVGSIAESREAVRTQLLPKIFALCSRRRPVTARPSTTTSRPRFAPPTGDVSLRRPTLTPRVDLLVIGSSTGGPEALGHFLPALPADFPVPVLITQHMPPVFTKQFADRLNTKCALEVAEAVEGEPIVKGRVLIAPGDWHLRVGGRPGAPVVALDQGPQENFCRPAVDVLFRSAAEHYRGHVLGVVLTGMGSDGALGAIEIAKAGGEVFAQDEQSSVVWGMPGAVAATGMASKVLPLPMLPSAVISRCTTRRDVRPGAPLTEGVRA